MGIINSGNELTNSIINVLKTAKFEIPKVDAETGKVEVDTRAIIVDPTSDDREKDFNGLVDFENAIQPAFDDNYNNQISTDDPTNDIGLKKIAEAISREVVSHIVKNAEVAMKDRMDQLEDDFNTMMSTFVSAFIPVAGTNGLVTVTEYNAMAAQVLATTNDIGGVGRSINTEKLKNTNERVVPSNPSNHIISVDGDGKVPVQIK